jgi:protoporphyrinogen oxidase
MGSPRNPGSTVILGAGPTGLGAAYRLHELGYDDFIVLEGADHPGGLASSVRDPAGFTWDLGGHVQFSHYTYYDEVLDRALGDAWLWHVREAWIWMKGRFIPYPFQLNIHWLDSDEVAYALGGLERAAAAPAAQPPRHFAEWIRGAFGEGIAELFMRPYNWKVWGYPLEEIAADWIGDRVATCDVDRVRANVRHRRDDPSWGPNSRFRFPQRGGTGAIWHGVAALVPRDRIRYGLRVEAVDLERRTAMAGGQTFRYDTLISSLPLDVLCAMAGPLSAGCREAARQLLYSSTHVVGVGLRGPQPAALETKSWMYFPEARSPYYRVTVFSNYSPHNVPEEPGFWSLMAEVSETLFKPVNAHELPQQVTAAMACDGLIAPATEIVSTWHTRLERGYPTPFVGRNQVLDRIMAELEAQGVFSRGRFGGWKYEVSNQDHSFMQGVEVASRLLQGAGETTYPRPDLANSGMFLVRKP